MSKIINDSKSLITSLKNSEYWNLFLDNGKFKQNIVPSKTNKTSYYDKPLISDYLIENNYSISYPDNKQFVICLTHDIDEIHMPYTHYLQTNIYYLKNKMLRKLKNNISQGYNRVNFKYDNLEHISNLEKKYNASSTFFVMASNDDNKRYRYDINDITEKLLRLQDNGHEIGLHGSFNAYKDLAKIKIEKKILEKILNKKVTGYRNHYLNFLNPQTWDNLSEAGFQYDSTFLKTRRFGFRNGLCHIYQPYNSENDQMINIFEIPLCFMDATLESLHIPLYSQWELVKTIMDDVERNKGIFTVLFHNDSLLSQFKNESLKLYEKILKEGYKRNAWITSCDELLKWWNKIDR